MTVDTPLDLGQMSDRDARNFGDLSQRPALLQPGLSQTLPNHPSQ